MPKIFKKISIIGSKSSALCDHVTSLLLWGVVFDGGRFDKLGW